MTKDKFINTIFNEDVLEGIMKIPDNVFDLIVTDPSYCLGKDYGKKKPEDYLLWSYKWIDAVLPKLKKRREFLHFPDMAVFP